MVAGINLNNKKFISAKNSAKLVGYTPDYVGQLCRSGKIECKREGKGWLVLEESLLGHFEISRKIANGGRPVSGPVSFEKHLAQFLHNQQGPDVSELVGTRNKQKTFSEKIRIGIASLKLEERIKKFEEFSSKKSFKLLSFVGGNYEQKTFTRELFRKSVSLSLVILFIFGFSSLVQNPITKSFTKVQVVFYENYYQNQISFNQTSRDIIKDFSVISFNYAKDKTVKSFLKTKEYSEIIRGGLVLMISDPASFFSAIVVYWGERFSTGTKFVFDFGQQIIRDGNENTKNFISSVLAGASNLEISSSFHNDRFGLIGRIISEAREKVVFASNWIIGKGYSAVAYVRDLIGSYGIVGGKIYAKIDKKDLKVEISEKEMISSGLVVFESQGKDRDSLMIKKVKDSFSDEVMVYPDEDGTSGIIKPVFKKPSDDSYLYVLVPVQEN